MSSDWGLMVLWTILAIAVVVAVIWAIASVARREQPTGGEPVRPAREVLDERLARGEIEADEYDRLREKIDHQAPPQSPSIV